MSAGLQGYDDGDSPARCFVCGALAVGPCARCRRPVCGDCCELQAGGVKTYAFCAGCMRAGGAALSRGWLTVLLWVAAPVVLAGVVLLIAFLAACGEPPRARPTPIAAAVKSGCARAVLDVRGESHEIRADGMSACEQQVEALVVGERTGNLQQLRDCEARLVAAEAELNTSAEALAFFRRTYGLGSGGGTASNRAAAYRAGLGRTPTAGQEAELAGLERLAYEENQLVSRAEAAAAARGEIAGERDALIAQAPLRVLEPCAACP